MGLRPALAAVLAFVAVPAAAHAAACPQRLDPADLASVGELRRLNAVEARLGARPTGSAAQARFVRWIERQARAVSGMEVRAVPYRIRRWDATEVRLEAGDHPVPVAGPVPYAASGDARGPLTYLPAGTPITAENSAGRIVLRDSLPGSVPFAVFQPGALGYDVYDPRNTLVGDFERDFLSSPIEDLRAAARAGARAVLFARDVPHPQAEGLLKPYEGVQWDVPAAYLGVDQGQRLKDLVAADPGAQARLLLEARRTPVTTRSIIATLPGARAQKVAVESHTDGANALWDNGPIAMLAMARALADLPRACRPRTIEFNFVTGHLYQRLVSPEIRDGGAERTAARLDREFERGEAVGALVLEHLGAREYAGVPRPGRPGVELRPTGEPEPLLVPVSDSAALRALVAREVRRQRLDRTAVIVGADAPDPERVPPHCSFGGEGTPYNYHLVPVVAPIAAPRILFSPAFGLEAIDFRLMRRQTIAFTDVLLAMSRMSRRAIAGNVLDLRERRAAGAPGCPVPTLDEL
ncbi:MAG TPA: hypothetical protein VIL49_18110 [Capillimicrobium sp.]